ncbi:MAG TPA: glycosyltransferase family 9 protein [Candidatus Fimivivens sp.]|nr:glycosyltransferase family 9 protein [Candidatus Fimivivens sp.]
MRLFDYFDEVVSLPRSFDYKKSLAELPLPKHAKFVDLMVEVSAETGYEFFDTPENRLHRNDTFSARLGVPLGYEKAGLPRDEAAHLAVMRLISNAKIDADKLVTVTFESMSPNRVWFPPYYKVLLESVIDEGFTVIIVGNRQVSTGLFPDSDRCVNLIGKTANLNEVAELVRLSTAVISVDTYLCHLAGIMDIPILGIFTGGINPDARLCYYDKKEVVTADLECACWDMGCRDPQLYGVEPCKINISPCIAMAAFKELIRKYG